ncbi:MAG: NAD-dependent epimerase/dehydratase family protein, partial [Sphingopyxis terrae]
PEANRNPEGAFRTNVFGTRNLLEAARQAAPRARFVFVSTADVYGDLRPEDLPITEATPIHPLNAYSISKAAAEMFCHQYGRVWGLPVIVLRPLNHTGPGQDARFVCSDFARQVARIKLGRQDPVVRVGNLAAERDFAIHQQPRLAAHHAVEIFHPQSFPTLGPRRELIGCREKSVVGEDGAVRPGTHRLGEAPLARFGHAQGKVAMATACARNLAAERSAIVRIVEADIVDAPSLRAHLLGKMAHRGKEKGELLAVVRNVTRFFGDFGHQQNRFGRRRIAQRRDGGS